MIYRSVTGRKSWNWNRTERAKYKTSHALSWRDAASVGMFLTANIWYFCRPTLPGVWRSGLVGWWAGELYKEGSQCFDWWQTSHSSQHSQSVEQRVSHLHPLLTVTALPSSIHYYLLSPGQPRQNNHLFIFLALLSLLWPACQYFATNLLRCDCEYVWSPDQYSNIISSYFIQLISTSLH